MNASRRARALIVLLAGAGPLPAQSLQDALAGAYHASAEIRAERARLREVNERVPQALAATRPTVQAFASAGDVHDHTNLPIAPVAIVPTAEGGSTAINLPRRSYGVSLSQPLFRGGATLAQIREARDLVRAERARLASVEQQVLLQAATAYVGVLLAEQSYDLATAQADLLSRQLAEAKGRFAEGALVRTDLLPTQAAVDSNLADLSVARARLVAARLAYVRDVGSPPGSVGFPTRPLPLPETREAAEQAALATNPDLREAEQKLAAAGQTVREARGAGLPSVSLQATLQHQEGLSIVGERDDTRAVTVQLRMPLYSGGLISSRLRGARAAVDEQQAMVDRQRDLVRAAAATAWEQVVATQAAAEASEAAVKVDALMVQGVGAQLAGGERTAIELLQVTQTLKQARQALLTAQGDALMARISLLAAVGGLAAALHVSEDDDAAIMADYRRVHLGPGR